MPIIYHVTTKQEWSKAIEDGFYEAPSLAKAGFIHCSQESQVTEVLQRYFRGKKDLVKLVIATDKLKSKYVFEWSSSMQDTFPHVYGTINKKAVVDVIEL